MIEGYLTLSEVAARIGVSSGRVRQMVANGRLPSVKVGKSNLVKESDLPLVENRATGRPASDNPSRAALAKRRQRERLADNKNGES